MRFLIKRATNGQYFFTVSGGNSEPMATSETYVRKASAQQTIDVIKRDAGDAQVVDLT